MNSGDEMKVHINGSTERRILDELMQSASDVQDQPLSVSVSLPLRGHFSSAEDPSVLYSVRRATVTAGTMTGFVEQWAFKAGGTGYSGQSESTGEKRNSHPCRRGCCIALCRDAATGGE